MPARSRWRRGARGRRRAAAVVLVGCLAPLLTAGPAGAVPSDQPGGTSGVLDSRELDRLQRRAAEVQDDLRAQQADVVLARDALAEAQRTVGEARGRLADARGVLAAHQREVAGYAAAVYRDGGALTPLTLLLTGADPGDVVAAMGFLPWWTRTPPRSSAWPRSTGAGPWTSRPARRQPSTRPRRGPTW